ncbi:hypothetical protein [Agromyces salentinus]|uniref:Uncharacterized protein n=1 Tax=Agromyces salentinus TaxID=269421 RepID=A0ABN2MZG0_9MICO|nr:hypothetical protein [Agromyces salentinus]
MEVIWASVIAVLGTLSGAALAFALQSQLSKRQLAAARRDRQREEYITAAADLLTTVTALMQAEYNRAKKRIEGVAGDAREQARQDAYDRRTAARIALYRLQLVGNPAEYRSTGDEGGKLIDLCRQISAGTATVTDVESRRQAARAALDTLIGSANARVSQL